MASWEQREAYLVRIAQQCLIGHKTFDLCRAHLVEASQISKGTIYNHFCSDADLMVAVSSAYYHHWLEQAQADNIRYLNALERFIFHHCKKLHNTLYNKDFVIERLMPNQEILEQANLHFRQDFKALYQAYEQWNVDTINAMGPVPGFDRHELVKSFIRGTMINCDDDNKAFDDITTYQKFSFALLNLTGHSDKRIPSKPQFELWFNALNKPHKKYINNNIDKLSKLNFSAA